MPAGTAIRPSTGAEQLRHDLVARSSVTERLTHNFGGAGDGYNPTAALLDVNGTLYGTTGSGPGASGSGTVFKIDPSGKDTVLHTFSAYANPVAKLINVNGTLYGTTFNGVQMITEPFLASRKAATLQQCTASPDTPTTAQTRMPA